MNRANPPQPPELQLAADVMHLRLLRLLDRHGRIGEVRARVLQCFAVEPQLVEVVAEVVVVMDVALRVRQIGRQLPATCQHLADRGVLGRVSISLEQQCQQVAANLDSARAVQVAEVQVGIDDELPQRLAVEDSHAHCAFARGDVAFIP
jgi:hypothetical protein